MSGVSPRVLNDLFNSRLNTTEGKEKLAAYGGSYIRDRLREVSFVRKIVPPEQVTRTDCQRSGEDRGHRAAVSSHGTDLPRSAHGAVHSR